MTDIARLGFDIETQPLARATGELKQIVASARQTQQAVDRLSASMTNLGKVSAANINAASVAFQKVSVGASSAAATVAAAHRNIGTAANASAVAVNTSSLAAARAAAAQSAAAAAAITAANAQNRLAANTNVAAAATQRSTSVFNTFNNSVTNTGLSVGKLAGMFGTLVAAFTTSAVIKAADAYTNLNNAMKLAGVTGSDFERVQNRLFDAANKNGVPVEALTTLYRRGSIAAAELGKSQEDLLKVVDVVAASLRIQGSSVEAARGALLQLGQSFGTGIVHAEEYNSLLENAFPLLQAAAKGMDGMGGSVAKLTNAVKNGQVSSRAFFEAIMKGGDAIIGMAGTINLTIGGAWQVVVNGFTELIGKIGDATGVTKQLSDGMVTLGRWLRELANDRQFLDDIKTLFSEITSYINRSVAELRSIVEFMKTAFNEARQFFRDANASATMINVPKINEQLTSLDSQISSETRKYENNLRTIKGPFREEELQKQFNLIQGMRQEYERLFQERTKMLNSATSAMIGDPLSPPVPPNRKSDWGIEDPSKLGDKGTATDIAKKNKGAEDSYRKLIQSAENYIAIEKEKTRALSMSVEEGQAFVHYQELMNKAQMAGIPITDALKRKLGDLAAQMAEVDNVYKSAKYVHEAKNDAAEFIAAQEVEREALFMSAEAAMAYRKEQELLTAARLQGLKLTPDQINDLRQIANATAAAAIETKNYQEAMDILREAGTGAIEGILQALVKGTSVWDAFANAATRALDRIISKISEVAMDELFDLFRGGSSGTAGGQGSGGILNLAKSIFNGGSSNATGGGFLSGLGSSLGSMWSTTSDWFGNLFNSQKSYSSIDSLLSAQSGTSALGYLGAGMGAISGLMQLIGGGGSTKSMIGGIGSMIGAGVSLIPGIGQIAGPIIGILSSVIPSLFGEENKRTHSYSNANLVYGPGGYYTNGSSQGNTTSTQSEQALRSVGGNIQAVYDMFGGVKDPSKVWGLNLNSWTAQGKDWSYTSNATSLVSPTGMQEAWRMNTDNMMDTGAAQVVIRTILEGALGEITDAMKTAMTTLKKGEYSLQEVADAVSFVKDVYDELGKPVLETKNALKALDTQFDAIRKNAEKLGLSLDPVNDALADARANVAKSFLHDINAYFDPVGTGMQDLADAADKARLEIQYLIDQGLANASDLNKVNNYYIEQETKLREKLYGVTLDNIRDVITRLTTGDLSGSTHTTQYSAAYESFFKTIQDALGGDTEASGRALDEAVGLANLGQGQYGSGAGYQNLKAEIAQALAQLENMVGGGNTPSGAGNPSTPSGNYSESYVQSLITQLAASHQAQMSQTQQINVLLAKLAQLSDQMQRIVTNI